MLTVHFYDKVDDALLTFAVIAARHVGKWVFCKHKKRSTYEFPGGRREPHEASIDETAKRELWEETGAREYDLRSVCVYSVKREGAEESYGMLYYADIHSFDALPPFEIEKIELFDALPEHWTYPLIQPKLLQKIKESLL